MQGDTRTSRLGHTSRLNFFEIAVGFGLDLLTFLISQTHQKIPGGNQSLCASQNNLHTAQKEEEEEEEEEEKSCMLDVLTASQTK